MTPIVVGYLLPDKVAAKLAGCLESDRHVQYTRLDPHRPLLEQGSMDVLLHKLAHEMTLGAREGAECGVVERVRDFLREHPNVAAVDSLDAAKRLSDRLATCLTLHAAAERGLRISQPRFAFVADTRYLAAEVRAAGLRHPIIAKPLVACGRAETHTMCVLASEEQRLDALESLPRAVLVQELVAHGGVVIKCYAVGRAVHATTRRSLPDMRLNGNTGRGVLVFDSQQPLPTAADWGVAAELGAAELAECCGRRAAEAEREAELIGARTLERVGLRALRWLAEAISDAFGGLRLFGFDVIVESASGRLLVVDVNSLPFGSHSFPGLCGALKAALVDAHERHQLHRLLRERWAAALQAAGQSAPGVDNVRRGRDEAAVLMASVAPSARASGV
ncbi:hypothetical protein KFE25_006045 [Diacronema lutheri]|uniref:Inositol-tetrakisphosphate 1-kinase n=3 Tax=Diacronema lutheri TaxID=2081491 RepID=A0A8J5XX68_DIALT|nr:hypothetical protein KFE25_006045 [Diacronema lutheri]